VANSAFAAPKSKGPKPGWGWGDKNHHHSGPPGHSVRTGPPGGHSVRISNNTTISLASNAQVHADNSKGNNSAVSNIVVYLTQNITQIFNFFGGKS
jgi:hypothetical protein